MKKLLAQATNLGGFQPKTGYGSTITNNPDSAGVELATLISNVIGFITVLSSVVFIGYFIWGAVDWITSGGDSGKVASARNKMIQGVIGMIVVVMSYGLIGLVGSIVGIDILDINTQIQNLVP